MSLSMGLDVCPPRHLRYIIFFIFRNYALSAYYTAFASCIYIDDITRPIAICNDTYKFAVYTYSNLQEFEVDSKGMVASHHEAVRKWHT